MHERPKLPDLALFHERGKQAGAEVVPSSSLIEVEVEVGVEVEGVYLTLSLHSPGGGGQFDPHLFNSF